MIAQQIGLDNDPHQVKAWSDAAVDRFSQMVSRERVLECARSLVAFQKYMKSKIDERRAHGGDDLLADLVSARVEGETPLTDEEIMSIMQQFMVAGNETTTMVVIPLDGGKEFPFDGGKLKMDGISPFIYAGRGASHVFTVVNATGDVVKRQTGRKSAQAEIDAMRKQLDAIMALLAKK